MTLLAAAATLLKGTADPDLILMGEALRSMTDDVLTQHFPNERDALLASIEAAFDRPVPPDRQPLTLANEILFAFVRDIHNEDPDAMAVLDTLTERVQREQEEARKEATAGLDGDGLDEFEAVGETLGAIVRSLHDQTQAGPSETTREIIGPRGERIVIRVVSGIAAEPDEDDDERHDTPERDDSDEETHGDDGAPDASDEQRPTDDDPRGASGGAGSGADDDLQAGEGRSVAGEDA